MLALLLSAFLLPAAPVGFLSLRVSSSGCLCQPGLPKYFRDNSTFTSLPSVHSKTGGYDRRKPFIPFRPINWCSQTRFLSRTAPAVRSWCLVVSSSSPPLVSGSWRVGQGCGNIPSSRPSNRAAPQDFQQKSPSWRGISPPRAESVVLADVFATSGPFSSAFLKPNCLLIECCVPRVKYTHDQQIFCKSCLNQKLLSQV